MWSRWRSLSTCKEGISSLNPGYNRLVIVHAAARDIVVPIDKVDQFHANMERNGDPLVTGRRTH
jgi:hypothetical protein